MVQTKTLQYAGVASLAAAILIAFIACGSDEEAASDATGSSSGASTAFIPGSAPPMPPLPPGAGPHGPNPNPNPDPPMDSGMPKDATVKDSPAPMDAAGE